MKSSKSLVLIPVLALLAACGTKSSSSATDAANLSGNDLHVTNKIVLSCKALSTQMDIKVRQYKDASGQYGSDSLYIIESTDYSQDPAVQTSVSATEARVMVPANTYWLLLGGKNGESFDVRANQTADGELTSAIKGTYTANDTDAAIYCAEGDVSLPGPILPTK